MEDSSAWGVLNYFSVRGQVRRTKQLCVYVELSHTVPSLGGLVKLMITKWDCPLSLLPLLSGQQTHEGILRCCRSSDKVLY